MRKIALLISLLTLLPRTAKASVAGKLDLSPNFDAAVVRELNDGMWLGGAQKRFFYLQRSDGYEVAHASLFWVTRPEAPYDGAFGLAVGTPVATWVRDTASAFSSLQAVANSTPAWVGKFGQATSLNFYTGYRPVIHSDDHHFVYGFGFTVTIPVDSILAWISKGQGGGL
jgi:hypothetical protein